MALTTAAPPQHVTDGEQRRPHLAALDGLRGLAVMAVLVFHAGKLQGGFLGVDLFFALSGYLITSLLLAEVDSTQRVDLMAFWGRRLRRLLPAVLFLLVGVTIITTLVATVPERAATIEDGPWVQAYFANWHAIAGHRDYWASFELPRMFGHLWSLAIEEQFYLIWPVLVGLIAWRGGRHVHRNVIIVCVGRLAVVAGPDDPVVRRDQPDQGLHRHRYQSQQPACSERCSLRRRCGPRRSGSRPDCRGDGPAVSPRSVSPWPS